MVHELFLEDTVTAEREPVLYAWDSLLVQWFKTKVWYSFTVAGNMTSHPHISGEDSTKMLLACISDTLKNTINRQSDGNGLSACKLLLHFESWKTSEKRVSLNFNEINKV